MPTVIVLAVVAAAVALGLVAAARRRKALAEQADDELGALVVDPGKPVHETVVDDRDEVERLVEAEIGAGAGIVKKGKHQRAPPAGNQCSSGIGSVEPGSSR